MSKTFTILLGGDLTVTDRLKQQVAGGRVIAADGGMAHAAVLGVEPELWVGDFDSTDGALAEAFTHVPRQSHPPAKDATDGELAVETAIALGAGCLVLAGAPGGQSDHAMGHVTMAVGLARRGLDVLLTSGTEEIVALLPGETPLDLPSGARLSIIGLSDLTGLTLDGVRWPLDERDVPLGSSLTMSNEAAGAVRIVLHDGYGVVVAYPLSVS